MQVDIASGGKGEGWSRMLLDDSALAVRPTNVAAFELVPSISGGFTKLRKEAVQQSALELN